MSQGGEEELKAEKRHCPGLKFILGDSYLGATEMPSADAEFNAYLTDSSVRREDGLLWWKTNIAKFPHAAVLARRYLGIPPTSAASERLFSLSGRVITKTRNRLLPETATCLVFLNKNLSALD